MLLTRKLVALSGLFALAVACDAGPYIRDCRNGSACGPDATAPFDGRTLDVTPIDVRDIFTGLVSIDIRPSDPTIIARGSPVNQDFAVVGRYRDGTSREIPLGTWRSTDLSLGDVNADSGRYTANGITGGVTRVEVTLPINDAGTLRAQTTLRVRVEREVFVGSTPESARARFVGTLPTDPTRQSPLRYPLNGSVMPQNVVPPDVQWEGGASGDVYRVSLSKPSATVTGYVTHSGAGFRFDWRVDADGWRSLAETEPDAELTVRVDHADARGAVAGAPVTMRIAPGSLLGVVYYWDLRDGKILSIANASDTSVDFMPSPPRRSSDGSTCVACHAISRDGRYMAAELYEGQGPSAVFDLTSDLRANPAPTRFPVRDATSWVYASWDPTSTRLVANRLGGLFLVDPATGDRVTERGTRLPQINAVQPAWSPDGRTIAFVNNFVGPGPTAFTQSELAALPVTAADTFGAATLLQRGTQLTSAPERGAAIAYPSWTPDSRWLAFQHGPYSESDLETTAGMPRRRFAAAMYLTAPTAGSTPMRMTNASGGDADADAYFPNFSPFDQGGYYWLVFFSRRDYGNAQAGTRGSGRRQLWVSAVNNRPTAGSDPSSAPYWLPGQAVGDDNVSGFWAPQPCAPRGARCRVSSECCNGVCGPDSTGALVCNPPPVTAPCRQFGERCGATGDCCMGLECAGNVCLRAPG